MSEIDIVEQGHRLTADEMNRRRTVMLRTTQGVNVLVDSTGTHLYGNGVAAVESEWYQLTSNLNANGTATGKKLIWDTGDGEYDLDTVEVTITDVFRKWGLKGERLCVAEMSGPDGIVYIALTCGEEIHPATLIQEPSSNIAQAHVTIRSIPVMVTAIEVPGAAGSGDDVTLEYDGEQASWRVLPAAGVASGVTMTVVTSVTINSTTGQLEVVTQEVEVVSQAGTSSTLLGTDTVVLESVGVSSPYLTKSPKTVVVLKADEPSTENYHTGGYCE